ncbi:MAG: carboxymuconolactone decarboxylase family protein [Elusimicrobia bacterium]|nr:carboxymuconolactone decarboxylase family protein [Elusimicrobiota bacterium]
MTTSRGRIRYEEFAKNAPAAHSALLALGKAVDDSGLEKQLTELVKLRASQINGCAFCLQYHLDLARKAGVDERKLGLLSAWRDASLFTPRETAALSWAEALTRIRPESASDTEYATLREQFSENEAIFLTVAIGTINQWNRIAVSLRFAPQLPR